MAVEKLRELGKRGKDVPASSVWYGYSSGEQWVKDHRKAGLAEVQKSNVMVGMR
jgi:hypothetical protein